MINIQDIIPFMKKGWVAMDKDGAWFWFEQKPSKNICNGNIWIRQNPSDFENISKIFDIAPADDWTKSLIKVGGVLAKVPSYEKYKTLENGILLANAVIKNTEKENAKLKELLKEKRTQN